MKNPLVIAILSCVACGSGDDASAQTDGATSGTDSSPTSTTAPTTTATTATTTPSTTVTDASDPSTMTGVDPDSSTGDAPPGECEPFGRFGVAETTFVLPARAGTSIYYDDIQASFPEVDWTTLDRLYIPAGQYLAMNLGNLPNRTPEDPLVITNMGGQVRIGPNAPDGNYLWVMNGGSNWIVTGRWDPDSGTGDEAFPGHRCGEYGDARGDYGFWSDDAFAMRQYLHMGISVGGAHSFELEFLEIERSGFAGVRLLNSWENGELPMQDVRVHDNYVHDTDGEGIYFGWTGSPPSNLLPGLQVYNNRFVRTGNEALQIQDIGPGSEIHHNVIAFAALHFRDNGLGMYQDGNAQISIREGEVAIHHNVFLGGGGTLVSFWSQPQTEDGARMVDFSDNYLGEVRSLGFYFGGTATDGSSFAFARNFLRVFEFSYDDLDPAAMPPTSVFRLSGQIGGKSGGDVSFVDNTWEGDLALVEGAAPTEEGNVNAAVEPIAFVNTGYAGEVLALEAWTPVSTLAPGMPPRDYVVGDLVMHDGVLYEAIAASTDQVPSEHPESWEAQPQLVDDFRVVDSSPYADFGVH